MWDRPSLGLSSYDESEILHLRIIIGRNICILPILDSLFGRQTMRLFILTCIAAVAALTLWETRSQADSAPAAGPYKVLKSEKVGGDGGFDYVYADAASRKLFIVRSGRPGGRADAYDLDTLKLAGSIADINGGHGVAVDAKSGHAFTSSSPVVMFDSKTLTTIKSIKVDGSPDGIMAEPTT